MEKEVMPVLGNETNILIELDEVAAKMREILESIDTMRALTVTLLQESIERQCVIGQ